VSSAELETLINFHWFRSGEEFELKTPLSTKSAAELNTNSRPKQDMAANYNLNNNPTHVVY